MEHADDQTPPNEHGTFAVSPMPRVEKVDSLKTWQALGLILAVITGAGTVTMGLGKAFFVTRDEYTTKERNDVVVGEVLKRLELQIGEQRAIIERLSDKISEMQKDLAVVMPRSRR